MFYTRVSQLEWGLYDLRGFMRLLLIALLFFAVQILGASSNPAVTGSYAILQHTASGSQAQVQIRIHLVNHGSSDISIQRITFWGLSHPEKGASCECTLTVRAHSSLETTQEFVIRRSQYQLWQRGLKPRFLLELGSPGRAAGTATQKSTMMIGLDRSRQEAK